MKGMGCGCVGITTEGIACKESGDGACAISCCPRESGKFMSGLRSSGVTRVSGEDDCEPWEEYCSWGSSCVGIGSEPSICWRTVEGVGDLVMGNDEKVVEGDGALATLPSLDVRLGLPEESYGLGRLVLESCFRFEGARASGEISVAVPAIWDQSESTFMKPLVNSACRVVFEDGAVLWSSVIMIGLDDPVPTIRPRWSIMVR